MLELVSYDDLNFASRLQIWGRLLIGLSCNQIVQRQFVVSFVPTSLIIAESARMVQFEIGGQIIGLLLGSFAQELSSDKLLNPVLPTRLANWTLSFLWILYLIYALYGWSELLNREKSLPKKHSSEDVAVAEVKDDSSDSSASEQDSGTNRLMQDYGGGRNDRNGRVNLFVANISRNAPTNAVDLNNAMLRRRTRVRTSFVRVYLSGSSSV